MIGYAGAFAALTFVLRVGVGVGVAYGIWAAAGVALTAILATVIFGDPLTVLVGAGIALVIGGSFVSSWVPRPPRPGPGSPDGLGHVDRRHPVRDVRHAIVGGVLLIELGAQH